MVDDEDGVPLREALERYADRELLRAFREAPAGSSHVSYLSTWIHGAEASAHNARSRQLRGERQQRQRLLHRAIDDLVQRLQSGELEATGMRKPIELASTRTRLQRELWRVLKPDFRNSSASGGDLTVLDILVRPAGSTGAYGDAESFASTPALPALMAPGEPVAPMTVPELIRAEIQRRGSAGLLTGSWYRDAQEIHRHLTTTNSKRKLPQWTSIKRRYGKDYQRAIEDNNRGQEEDMD